MAWGSKPQRCTEQVGNCRPGSVKCKGSRSQWPRGLRRGFAAARLLRLWVRILPGHGCLSVVSVVRYRSLRRADPSSRGVLPTEACRCV